MLAACLDLQAALARVAIRQALEVARAAVAAALGAAHRAQALEAVAVLVADRAASAERSHYKR
jgi:hypothetical protein